MPDNRSYGKPRLLDLFCGAGGCTKGYQRAGFHVTGIDYKPQPNYCGDEFIQGDALEASIHGFDAIHASPPCQAHSTIGGHARRRVVGLEHVDLVEPTRAKLVASGLPYVIENVPGAPLINAIQLCGSSFGLDVRRHRLFESNVSIMAMPCAHYWQMPRFIPLDSRRNKPRTTVPVHGTGRQLASVVGVHGNHNYAGEREIREAAMGIDWMTPYELTQAIPPVYTEHIGHYLMTGLRNAA